MPEIPLGFSLDEDEDGLIFRRKDNDGMVTAIKLSAQDIFGLKASIDLWSDRKMSEYQGGSGLGVKPIVVYPVAQVRLLPDALQANVLLSVAAPSGQQMTLSFPLPVADHIAAELPGLLAKMRSANPVKQ